MYRAFIGRSEKIEMSDTSGLFIRGIARSYNDWQSDTFLFQSRH